MSGVYIRYKSGKKKLRMAALNDIREHKTQNLIKDINLGSWDIFDKKPSKCCACNSKYIYSVELFGARHAPLLWECGKCSKTFLRYDVKETLADLFYAKRVWTNPQDWGYQDPSDFN